MKKLLFYGGAFNPPHRGHERIFEAALEAVKPDKALIIPTGVSPHKARSKTPYWDRYNMSRCFLKYGSEVSVSSIEGRGHRCYTIETVKRLQKKYPSHEIYMLIGSDMVTSFHTWHLYRRLLSRVVLVCGCRDDDEEAAFLAAAERLKREGGRLLLLRFDPVEISSTDIRNALEKGESTEKYLSPSVSDYIHKNGLYGVKK